MLSSLPLMIVVSKVAVVMIVARVLARNMVGVGMCVGLLHCRQVMLGVDIMSYRGVVPVSVVDVNSCIVIIVVVC
jgi:hypothetical protein